MAASALQPMMSVPGGHRRNALRGVDGGQVSGHLRVQQLGLAWVPLRRGMTESVCSNAMGKRPGFACRGKRVTSNMRVV